MKKKKLKTEQKRFSRKQMYLLAIGSLIILIMVGSALDLGSQSEEEGYDYKGINFVQANEGWLAYLDSGRKVLILNNPAELANMTLEKVDFSGLNMMQKIYITTNPQERVRNALIEFYREMPLSPVKVPACTEDVPGCENLPLKTCNDTASNVGVVMFRQANETRLEFKDNCLIIEGQNLDKIVDKMILESL